MKYLKRINEDLLKKRKIGWNKPKVFIEPLASSSDFWNYIEECTDMEADVFFDDMDFFSESKISSRFDRKHCQDVIEGNKEYYKTDYYKRRKRCYEIILKFLEEYDLETVRFEGDW